VETQEGKVIRSTGAAYRVRTGKGEVIECSLRGKFRLDDLKTTNPLAVGDQVEIRFEGSDWVISKILPRNNYLLRKAVKLSSQTQMLCANIDQAVLIVTLSKPFTPLGYIDRFLVMAEAYHIPVVLLFNKIDLITSDKEKEKLIDFMFTYADIGYAVDKLVATDLQYQTSMQDILKDKVSFIAGPSGAGKSSFINLVDPELNLKTGLVSEHTEKGKHTTTFAELFQLHCGGEIIDAPGFREFDITGIERTELSHYFREMRPLLPGCRFNNCTHTNEPGCAVKAALEEGELAHTRYNTYLGMLESIEQPYK
jgi:ribosome biogenesis GTPase